MIIMATKNFYEWVKPKDIIAFVVIIFCLYLIAKGINHIVSGVTIAIVSYYFGRRLDYKQKKGS